MAECDSIIGLIAAVRGRLDVCDTLFPATGCSPAGSGESDAADTADWWDGQSFDGILLDAPCTASGIGRRHPDVRWLRRDTDVAQLAAIQAKLLKALWPLVKPGGRLLFCTCSVFKAEGETQIQTFVQHNTDALILPSSGHITPSSATSDTSLRDNVMGEHDGFYYALLEKRSI